MNVHGVFEQAYPALSRWLQGSGCLEVGHVSWSQTLIRVLDEGGLIWEEGAVSGTLSKSLAEAEAALTTWFQEEYGGH